MSNTPRTDKHYALRDPWKNDLDFARALERELTLAQSELASCRQQTMMDTECIERIRIEALILEVERNLRVQERDKVASELAAALRENASLKEHCDQSDKELAQLTDALGCPCEMPDAQGKALERPRDLIATEGEAGDLRADADRKTALIVELREKLVTAEQERDEAQQWIDSDPEWKSRYMEIDAAKDKEIEALQEKLRDYRSDIAAGSPSFAPPSPVCRHCGKVESEHSDEVLFCYPFPRPSPHTFTPISPEPISTGGNTMTTPQGKPAAAESPILLASQVPSSSDVERQELFPTPKQRASYAVTQILLQDGGDSESIIESAIVAGIYDALATAQERIAEQEQGLARAKERIPQLERIIWVRELERDSALTEVAELETQLAVASAEAARFKTERDGALHSSESWELLHAKRHEELGVALAAVAELKKERDDNARIANQIGILEDETRKERESIQKVATDLRTQLDLAQRQIAAKDAALQKFDKCTCSASHKTIASEHAEFCSKRIVSAALSPSSARLYVRREVLDNLTAAAMTARTETRIDETYRVLDIAIAAAESELAGGAE